MLKNYLNIAIRNLLKRRFYAAINIVGLAVGITFTLLIGSYVWSELQVNQTLRHAGQQCLVQSRWKTPNMGMDITTLAPIGPALKTHYPALVANYYRFHGVSATLSHGASHFRESIQIGDSTLLTMYGFSLLHGNPRTALAAPNAIVISRDKALKLFGRTNVLNQPLTVETPQSGKQSFLITGVLKPLPPNSVSNLLSEANDVFMTMGALPAFGADMTNWQNPYIVTYVELQPGVLPGDLDKPLAQLIATNTPAPIQKNLIAYVTPLTDYYLLSNNGLVRKLIGTLLAVALFILLMAIVNFITIALSNSSSRLREIGVRKALGGLRKQLAAQFLVEALTLTALATVLSIGLYVLFQPLFSEVVGKPIPALTSLPGQHSWLILVFVLLIGGVAGGYPALYLSAYSPVDSLKGKQKSVRAGNWLRRSLVTVQFTMAIMVLIGAFVVSRQISYFFNTNLGFTKEAMLTVSSLPRTWSAEGVAQMEAARNQFARLPGVASASLSFEIPNGNAGSTRRLYPAGQDSTQAVSMVALTTDENYAQTYRINILSGQYFQHGVARQDSGGIVLNKAAATRLGYPTPEAAVDKMVFIQGSPQPLRVLGVISNFHFGSMHKAIEPMVIWHIQNVPIYRFFSFRLSGNARQTIARLEQTWHTLFPEAPFDYAFLDLTLQKMYRTELQLEKAAYIATGLSLLIVLLGLIGLVSLSVSRRTKEVGIRKVLGASVPTIILLFLSEYAWVLLVANAIAGPFAYWLVTSWLADYAYHTPVTGWPFGLVGAGLALLTVLVVSVQVIKAALMNPVKSLRSE